MNHGIANVVVLEFQKNDLIRIRARCKGNNCTWRIFGKVIPNAEGFEIHTLQPKHTCSRSLRTKWLLLSIKVCGGFQVS